MNFKMRYTKTPGHVYCTLFVANAPNMTYANATIGKFVVRLDEFADLQRCMSGIAFEENTDESNAVQRGL